jgi:hypothetical protein
VSTPNLAHKLIVETDIVKHSCLLGLSLVTKKIICCEYGTSDLNCKIFTVIVNSVWWCASQKLQPYYNIFGQGREEPL